MHGGTKNTAMDVGTAEDTAQSSVDDTEAGAMAAEGMEAVDVEFSAENEIEHMEVEAIAVLTSLRYPANGAREAAYKAKKRAEYQRRFREQTAAMETDVNAEQTKVPSEFDPDILEGSQNSHDNASVQPTRVGVFDHSNVSADDLQNTVSDFVAEEKANREQKQNSDYRSMQSEGTGLDRPLPPPPPPPLSAFPRKIPTAGVDLLTGLMAMQQSRTITPGWGEQRYKYDFLGRRSLIQQESPGGQDSQNAMNGLTPEPISCTYARSLNAGYQSYAAYMKQYEKRKYARVGGKDDHQGALYQRERQKKYKQDSTDREQQMQKEQKRVIEDGQQTPEEVFDYLEKIDARTETSEKGKKLVMQIQSLENVMIRNSTQRGQLHRTRVKLDNLKTEERIKALQELSAQNAIMSLSESASDFCAPT